MRSVGKARSVPTNSTSQPSMTIFATADDTATGFPAAVRVGTNGVPTLPVMV